MHVENCQKLTDPKPPTPILFDLSAIKITSNHIVAVLQLQGVPSEFDRLLVGPPVVTGDVVVVVPLGG